MAVYEVLSLATRIARQQQGEMMISGRPYTITHYTVGNQGHDPQDRYNALSPDVNLIAPVDEVITPQKITSAIPYDAASGFGPTWICTIPAGLATGVLSSLYLWADMAKPQTPGFPIPPQVANLPTVGTRGQTCEVMEWGYYQYDGGKWALQSPPPSVTALPLTPAVGETANLTLPDPPYAPGEYVYDGAAWAVLANVIALPVPAPFVYDVVHLQGVLPAPVPSKYVWDEGTAAWVSLYLPPVPRFVDLPTIPVPVIGQRAYVILEGVEYFWNEAFWEHAYDRFLFAICNMPELIKLAEETDEYHVGVQF
jgi:hypothetical protein